MWVYSFSVVKFNPAKIFACKWCMDKFCWFISELALSFCDRENSPSMSSLFPGLKVQYQHVGSFFWLLLCPPAAEHTTQFLCLGKNFIWDSFFSSQNGHKAWQKGTEMKPIYAETDIRLCYQVCAVLHFLTVSFNNVTQVKATLALSV